LQPELVATFQQGYAEVVKILAYAAEVTLLKKGAEEAPEGCAVNIINQHCEINLFLKVNIPLSLSHTHTYGIYIYLTGYD